MSIGSEVSMALSWIGSVCTTNVGITGIVADKSYSDLAPKGTSFPFIVYQHQANNDLNMVGPDRLWNDGDYLIRGMMSVNSFEPLEPLAEAIDAAFSNTTASVGDGVVISTRRRSQYALVEEYEGRQVRQLGGIYRVIVQGS